MGVAKRDASGVFDDTLHVNRRGMTFVTREFMPEWMEMNVKLQVPAAGTKKQRDISCHAAVVQCEKQTGGRGYRVALFFLDLSKRDAECLKQVRPSGVGSSVSISH